MTYDCFLYSGEKEIIQARFDYLNDYVDYFLIVESKITFQGKNRVDIFSHNDFNVERKKIKHIIISEELMLSFDTSRDKEKFLRNSIYTELLKLSVLADDIIIISDVDEIPSIDAILNYKDGIVKLKQYFLYFYNNYIPLTGPYWCSSFISRFSDIDSSDIDDIRFNFSGKYSLSCYSKGGWHFSYYGGINSIRIKLTSIGDNVESFNNFPDEYFEEKIKSGRDIFGRDIFWIPVSSSSIDLCGTPFEKFESLKTDTLMLNFLFFMSKIPFFARAIRLIYRLWLKIRIFST
jgi:hypothetical protein